MLSPIAPICTDSGPRLRLERANAGLCRRSAITIEIGEEDDLPRKTTLQEQMILLFVPHRFVVSETVLLREFADWHF